MIHFTSPCLIAVLVPNQRPLMRYAFNVLFESTLFRCYPKLYSINFQFNIRYHTIFNFTVMLINKEQKKNWEEIYKKKPHTVKSAKNRTRRVETKDWRKLWAVKQKTTKLKLRYPTQHIYLSVRAISRCERTENIVFQFWRCVESLRGRTWLYPTCVLTILFSLACSTSEPVAGRRLDNKRNMLILRVHVSLSDVLCLLYCWIEFSMLGWPSKIATQFSLKSSQWDAFYYGYYLKLTRDTSSSYMIHLIELIKNYSTRLFSQL